MGLIQSLIRICEVLKMKIKKKITLITTPIPALLPKHKTELLLLGPWFKINLSEGNLNKYKYKIIEHPWKSYNLRLIDFKYIKRNYLKLCSKLSEYLNRIHNKKYSEKYWEQIIGVWLYNFLISVYEKYKIVKKIDNSKKIKIIKIYKNNNFIGVNSKVSRNFYHSHYWDNHILTYLIEKLKKKIQVKIVKDKSITKNMAILKKREVPTSYVDLIKKYSTKIGFNRTNKKEIFLINTFLGLFNELKLQLSINKSPKVNISHNDLYKYNSSPNFNLRNKIFDYKKNDDEFMLLLKQLLIKNIPLAYLEEYNNINEFNKRLSWNKNPKKIFTAASNIYDDLFKIWLANQKEKGCRFFYGQHGSQFISNFSTFDHYLTRTSDKILTWGKKYKKNKIFLPFFNFKTANNKFISRIKKNIILIQEMPPVYTNDMWSGLSIYDYEDYLSLQNKFLKLLNKYHYEKTIVRFGSSEGKNSTNNCLKYEKKRWFSMHPELKFETRNQRINKTLEKSYLTLLTTVNATTLLECLSSNIPFLVLSLKYERILSKETIKDFKILEKKNILFSNPKKLAKFINNFTTKDDVDNWWFSKQNQTLIKNFQKKYADNSLNPIKDFKKRLILNEKNKKL